MAETQHAASYAARRLALWFERVALGGEPSDGVQMTSRYDVAASMRPARSAGEMESMSC